MTRVERRKYLRLREQGVESIVALTLADQLAHPMSLEQLRARKNERKRQRNARRKNRR